MPKNTRLHDLMEQLAAEMVDAGILWDEAAGQFEKQFIQCAMARSGCNRSRASQAMGIHRNTLSRKITLYRIPKEKSR